VLDADRRFEDLLRATLREEAAAAPFTLTFDDLERRLAERQRRRSRRSMRLWIAAAALLVVALAGAAGIAALLLQPAPEPTPPPTLPTSTDLLDAVPEATTRLEGRRDATAPDASPAPDDRYVVGTIAPAYPFVVVAACIGGDRMTTEVGTIEGVGTYLSSPVPCDGDIHTAPMTGAMTGERLDVIVTAPAAVSWILAVREYPESYADPPDLAPIAITPGWQRLLGDPDEPPRLTTPADGTGIAITVPPTATRVAAWITCSGDAAASGTLGASSATIDCPAGATARLEAPADATGRMNVRVETEGLVWVRVVVEVDAGLEIVYPTAPPLPSEVAAATWATTGTQYLTVGTIGGNAPRLVELPSHRAAVARGDVVVVPVTDGDGRGRIELVSVSSASVVRTILDSDRFVQDAWFDATHEVVVYVVGTGDAISFRAVTLDGTDDRLLVEVPVADPTDPLFSLAPGLARDDSVFVVEACRAAGCERTIIDLASGETRTVDTTAAPVCGMIGVIDGLVVGRYRAGCERDDTAPVSVVVSPLDGGPSRTLEAVGDMDGIVVPTPEGPRLVLTSPPADAEPQRIVSVDPTTGEVSTIHEADPEATTFLLPDPARLPDGWVLLATTLSDDPAGRGFLVRSVPLLVNLTTGEAIRLPNLPHSIGDAP
jgi:hypothetical protein